MRAKNTMLIAALALSAFAACGDDAGSSAVDAAAPDAPVGPPVAVSGMVHDSNGQGGLVGATVEIVGASPAIHTTSGANGAYTLAVLTITTSNTKPGTS